MAYEKPLCHRRVTGCQLASLPARAQQQNTNATASTHPLTLLYAFNNVNLDANGNLILKIERFDYKSTDDCIQGAQKIFNAFVREQESGDPSVVRGNYYCIHKFSNAVTAAGIAVGIAIIRPAERDETYLIPIDQGVLGALGFRPGS